MIRRVGEADPESTSPQLSGLLRQLVDDGASIGFVAPMSSQEADAYWTGIFEDVAHDTRILLCSFAGHVVTGTVQLRLEPRPNGRHRGEVQKLLVHPSFQRRGIARALMEALEGVAADAGISLLLLDTREGDAANNLYQSMGWTEVGKVPGWVRDADGEHATVFYYKRIDGAHYSGVIS